jgi:hypothetical protein
MTRGLEGGCRVNSFFGLGFTKPLHFQRSLVQSRFLDLKFKVQNPAENEYVEKLWPFKGKGLCILGAIERIIIKLD